MAEETTEQQEIRQVSRRRYGRRYDRATGDRQVSRRRYDRVTGDMTGQ
jgi:hypothetical protein